MEREIRYCSTADGVRIAYCVEGEGAPTILALPAMFESFSLDYLMPVYQQFYRDLGADRRVIRFDWRGSGLSAEVPEGISSARGNLQDLEAVAGAIGQSCVVWASTTAGPAALAFVVAHPDLVDQLILYGTYATVADALSQSLRDGIRDLARANWEMATRTIADMNGRREFPYEAAQLGEWFFRSMPQEVFLAESGDSDRRPSLSQVHVPTLILHGIADPAIPFSAGQKLAAGIPGARFVPLEGKGHLFCFGDYSNILAAVDDVLGDRAQKSPHRPRSSGVHTVLFTDLVGHTEMMQRLGDAKGRVVLREHERITRDLVRKHEGNELKSEGDSFMVSFASVTAAVDCAIALQRTFAARNDAGGEPLHVRIGLNAGEPVEEDGDLFGSSVIIAARVAAAAAAGEILIPEPLRHLLAGKSYVYADRGETILKGFEDAVRLYEVRWRE